MEDGVAAINPEHPPPPSTTADGAASVHSPENQLGGGVTMVPMVAVKEQGEHLYCMPYAGRY